jgi:hypothetical protein
MTIYLAQVDLANPAAGRAHVVEPRTFGCDRADSRIEICWAKNTVLVAAERELEWATRNEAA